jgi:hypothetical protein
MNVVSYLNGDMTELNDGRKVVRRNGFVLSH